MKLSEALILSESLDSDLEAIVRKTIKASERQKETNIALSAPKQSILKDRYMSSDLVVKQDDYFLLNAKRGDYVIEYTLNLKTKNVELVQIRYLTTEKLTAMMFDDVVKEVDKKLGSKYEKRPSEFRGIKDIQWFLKSGELWKNIR